MSANSLAPIKKNNVVAVRARASLWRDTTEEEHQAWRDSDSSKGMDCAGETKLDSPSRYLSADGSSYRVVRARVQCRRGWSSVGKCCQVVDSDGVHWFVYRKDVFVVQES
jgi:hypothetical protein